MARKRKYEQVEGRSAAAAPITGSTVCSEAVRGASRPSAAVTAAFRASKRARRGKAAGISSGAAAPAMTPDRKMPPAMPEAFLKGLTGNYFSARLARASYLEAAFSLAFSKRTLARSGKERSSEE